MDSFKANVCRMCLAERNVKFNWNNEVLKFCGISYKECYYKYTQLTERDPDCLPTNLCERCANEVKNAYILFERALDSFNILCNALEATECAPQDSYIELCDSPQKMICETFSPDENNYIVGPIDEKLEIDDVICYSPVYDNDVTVEVESPTYNCKENSMSGNVNIENLKSLEIPLEQQQVDSCDITLRKSTVDEKTGNKKASNGAFETTLELKLQLKIHGTKLFKPSGKTARGKTKINKSFHQASKKEQSISCDAKSIPNLKGQKTGTVQNSMHRLSPRTPPNINKFLRRPKQTSFEENTQSCRLSERANSEQKIYEDISNSSVHFAFNTKVLQKNDAPLELNPCESGSNSSVPLASDLSNPLEVQTFSVTKRSVEQLNPNESSDCSLLELSVGESYPNSPAPLSVEHSKPKEIENSFVATRRRKKKRVYDPSEISLLHEIFGKNYDINSLLPKSTRKPREKICQYCSIKVNGTSHLMAHEATHIENRERNVICPHCGIKLYTKLALTEHLKIHDDKREKKHKCEFCEKAFFHKGALNVHRRIHLGLMVKCQICPKEFYRQIDLDRHLVSHSATPLQNNGVKNVKYTVQCQYCNKSVYTYKWREHKAAHLNQPEVKCKICDKDFFSRQSCTKHLNKVHRKTAKDYDDHIHYYVDCSSRLSHLMIRQQESVQPLAK